MRGKAQDFHRLIGILVAFAIIPLSLWNPVFIQNLRLQVFDAYLRQSPGAPTDTPIFIVDIDDRSLAILGQWPWPRTIMANILSLINQGHPKAIGLDIVYSEPDRSSPRQVAAFLASENLPDDIKQFLFSLPDNDQLLAQTLLETPTILGYPFAFTSSVGNINKPQRQPGRFAIIGTDPTPWLFEAISSDANLPLLEKSAASSGFFNILPNDDGIVRNIPLVMSYADELYPSLAVEMLRVGEGISTIQVRSTKNGIEAIRIGSHIIPTDAYGQMKIHYCGPNSSFPYISVADLLSGKINVDVFRDAYVLIGSSAPCLVDIMATPTSSMFPGIEIHAHALNTIIADSYLLQPDWSRGAELVYLLFISIILIVFLPRSGAVRSGIFVLVLSIRNGDILPVEFYSQWLFCGRGLSFPQHGCAIHSFDICRLCNCRKAKKRDRALW